MAFRSLAPEIKFYWKLLDFILKHSLALWLLQAA